MEKEKADSSKTGTDSTFGSTLLCIIYIFAD